LSATGKHENPVRRFSDWLPTVRAAQCGARCRQSSSRGSLGQIGPARDFDGRFDFFQCHSRALSSVSYVADPGGAGIFLAAGSWTVGRAMFLVNEGRHRRTGGRREEFGAHRWMGWRHTGPSRTTRSAPHHALQGTPAGGQDLQLGRVFPDRRCRPHQQSAFGGMGMNGGIPRRRQSCECALAKVVARTKTPETGTGPFRQARRRAGDAPKTIQKTTIQNKKNLEIPRRTSFRQSLQAIAADPASHPRVLAARWSMIARPVASAEELGLLITCLTTMGEAPVAEKKEWRIRVQRQAVFEGRESSMTTASRTKRPGHLRASPIGKASAPTRSRQGGAPPPAKTTSMLMGGHVRKKATGDKGPRRQPELRAGHDRRAQGSALPPSPAEKKKSGLRRPARRSPTSSASSIPARRR